MEVKPFLDEALEVLAPIVRKHFPNDNHWSFSAWIKKDKEGRVYFDGIQYGGKEAGDE